MRSLILCLALLASCATHTVGVETTAAGKAWFDVPRVTYVAATGTGLLIVTVDGKQQYQLDVPGKKAWKRQGLKFVPVEWDEAALFLGLE